MKIDDDIKFYGDRIDILESELASAKRKLEVARKALEWYANKNNYGRDIDDEESNTEHDEGGFARDALAEISEEKK